MESDYELRAHDQFHRAEEKERRRELMDYNGPEKIKKENARKITRIICISSLRIILLRLHVFISPLFGKELIKHRDVKTTLPSST
jgi:hypothetical protein